MPNDSTGMSAANRTLRLWPGFAIVAVQWLARFVLPAIWPEAGPAGAIGALLGGLLFILWWAFFSRGTRRERWGGAALMLIALFASRLLLHESLANAGMGVVFFLFALPCLCLAFLIWAVVSRGLTPRSRSVAMVATVLAATGVWLLLRTTGITGGGQWDFKWRWSQTAEEKMLAAQQDAAAPSTGASFAADGSADWPGFRGPRRDSVVHGTRLETDWSSSPPAELWRKPIGPGWSSFAVLGDRIYTQEQRGEEESVSCYSARTGELLWRHGDLARFSESQAGAGPRATPTVHEGTVYSFGATGILNALDARDGSLLWTRATAADAETEIPGWGFASSPLVVDDIVIVHPSRLAAYDRTTGELRWLGSTRSVGYSSPHRMTIDGVTQIVQLGGTGATGVDPRDGSVLWEHPYSGGIVQPAQTADGDVLINGGGMTGGLGIRRVGIAREGETWTGEERWTSIRLKPNFNDYVVHKGHAYGFDGSILACMGLEEGDRKWKGGRYGNGQLILLAEQDLLLVLSEKGELVLVSATPDQFTEVARAPAIEGKTWNHPVLVGDRLLVRNGQEMAAFRLALEPREAGV